MICLNVNSEPIEWSTNSICLSRTCFCAALTNQLYYLFPGVNVDGTLLSAALNDDVKQPWPFEKLDCCTNYYGMQPLSMIHSFISKGHNRRIFVFFLERTQAAKCCGEGKGCNV